VHQTGAHWAWLTDSVTSDWINLEILKLVGKVTLTVKTRLYKQDSHSLYQLTRNIHYYNLLDVTTYNKTEYNDQFVALFVGILNTEVLFNYNRFYEHKALQLF